MNLTKIMMDTAPCRERLDFGVSRNVKLKKISNKEIRDSKGQKLNKNCFVTLVEIDKETDKVVRESTFSYFNLDNHKYAKTNFRHQLIQLMEILRYTMPKENSSDVLKKIDSFMIKNSGDFTKVLKNKIKESDLPAIKELMSNLIDEIIKVSKPYFNKGEYVQILIACDKSGRYLDLPKEDKGFIAINSGDPLKIPGKYLRWRKEKDTPKKDTADIIGDTEALVEAEDILSEVSQAELDAI